MLDEIDQRAFTDQRVADQIVWVQLAIVEAILAAEHDQNVVHCG